MVVVLDRLIISRRVPHSGANERCAPISYLSRQAPHDLLDPLWLSVGKKIVGELASLAQIQQQNLSLTDASVAGGMKMRGPIRRSVTPPAIRSGTARAHRFPLGNLSNFYDSATRHGGGKQKKALF